MSVNEFFTKYNDYYSKVVLYDPNLPATINIATMIASVENGIVIHPDDLAAYGTGKTVTNLEGVWTTNLAAYQWAWNNYWDKMNHYIACNFHPTATAHHIRDFLISDRVFITWVTGRNIDDGIVSDYDDELAFTKMVWANSPVNIPIIGWWGTLDDDGMGEYYGVGWAGEYGKLCVPNDWTTNSSLLKGMRVDIRESVKKYGQLQERQAPVLDNSKVYVCFNIMDSGDAPGYWQGVQIGAWGDTARGQIPIGWSMAGEAWEQLPAIMDWFYQNATANDDFFLGLSGATYTHPYRNFLALTPDYNAAWDEYLALTQYYMDYHNIGKVGLYIDASSVTRAAIDPTTLKFVNGLTDLDMLILGMHRNEGVGDWNYRLGTNNNLCSHVITRWNTGEQSEENNQWLADDIVAHTPVERPGFVNVQCISWAYWPTQLVDVYNRLPSEYEVVSQDEFIQLYQQAGN